MCRSRCRCAIRREQRCTFCSSLHKSPPLSILSQTYLTSTGNEERSNGSKFIQSVFATMRSCPQHTFQILTKRSGRLRKLAAELAWPQNVWMGVSVEDARVVQRIHDLRPVPAAVRFLSCEPLIGPLDELPLDSIHWVIVGGESGPGARPMKIEWIRGIFRQCRQSNVPFFFKQWGGVRKDLTGRKLNGRTYDEMPALARSEEAANLCLAS